MSMEHPVQSNNLVEVLEKILDKGVVIAGDIKISLADIELLQIKIRLIVASVDKAKEMGMDWWENDPYLSSRADRQLQEENRRLENRIQRLERSVDPEG
ncbi:gas vesicle protein [Salinithrix halophila]|uniref:Gas vesicle protein n=1 Tax=Salinithrix halophila TaxID=1485204 RepID=A0ABV8JIY9_9BACL